MQKRRRTALIAAAVVIILGGVGAGTGVAVAANAETVRQCDVAQGKLSKANAAAKKAAVAATAAVKTSESTLLPDTDGWTSRKYSEKPASTAQPKASSGKDRLTAVATRQERLRSLATGPLCESRDDADAVTARASAVTTASKRLAAAASDLRNDFATFQADETTRIATEKAAAKKAAEEAARQAQAAEAARLAAAAPKANTGSSSSAQSQSMDGTPSAGGTGSEQSDRVTAPWGSSAPRKRSDFVGGGGVGSGGGGCWTSNGHGGTMRC